MSPPAYGTWRTAREARQAAEKDVEATVRERELLEWQVKELVALDSMLPNGRKRNRSSAGWAMPTPCWRAQAPRWQALEEGEAASLPVLQHAGARLSELTGFDPALTEAAELFQSALIQLEESALALRRYQDRLEAGPGAG